VVVTSSAIPVNNPEVAEARRLHVPVIQRAEMLAELMRLKYGIAIAGMHGKTTTTSMVAAVLAAGGLDPTVVLGGRVDAMGSNARLGKSHYLVAEADESDRSFLKLSPILSVVTNIDREHMDCYRDMRDVRRTFLEFMERVPFYGVIVACNDDPILRRLLPRVHRRVTTYGTTDGSDFLIRMESLAAAGRNGPYRRFSVSYKEKDLGGFTLHVPGTHNVLNATAAIAVGTALDIPPDQIRSALDGFRGVDRRFQRKGEVAGVSVIDDYGHHPTEIRATLAAARQCGFRRVHVIFQPHRFTRTRDLMDEFSTAFCGCRYPLHTRHLSRQRKADRGHHRGSARQPDRGDGEKERCVCLVFSECRGGGCRPGGTGRYGAHARCGERLAIGADGSAKNWRVRTKLALSQLGKTSYSVSAQRFSVDN
jgi:UDP-N-acetylmuramate--alanine ligase